MLKRTPNLQINSADKTTSRTNNKITLTTEENINTESNFLEEDIHRNNKRNKIFPFDSPQHKNQNNQNSSKRKKSPSPTIGKLVPGTKRGTVFMRKESIKSHFMLIDRASCMEFMSNSSCFIFHSNSGIRKYIGKLIESKVWEYFIICTVF